MISSISFLNKIEIIILILFLSVFISAKGIRAKDLLGGKDLLRIAVYPVENLSGTSGPLKEIRQSFIERLNREGSQTLSDEDLEKFMARHRIRYTGGVDRQIARAFKEEVGVDGVLITSLELYSEVKPPKISLLSRLVSTDPSPLVLWMDGIGLAGDDSPGFLSLGLIEEPKVLVDRAMRSMTDSLILYLSGLTGEAGGKGLKKRFKPKIVYRSSNLSLDKKYLVAVLPFFNRSERKYAGEILVLHFIRQLKRFGHFEVVEPGVLRQELLGLRVIMEDGVSLANADAIFAILDADLIVSGRVVDYQDYQGTWGKPKVDFSTVIIERTSRQVVWGSNSYNEGDDGVFFFDRGKVNTAHTMTSQMVQAIVKMIAEDQAKLEFQSGRMK